MSTSSLPSQAPDPELPTIFPPKLTDLKGTIKEQKKLIAPLLPKSIKKRNESAKLLDRIK